MSSETQIWSFGIINWKNLYVPLHESLSESSDLRGLGELLIG